MYTCWCPQILISLLKCNFLLVNQISRLIFLSEIILLIIVSCYATPVPHTNGLVSTTWLLTQFFTDSLLLQPKQLKPLFVLCILRKANFLYGVWSISNVTWRERITSTGILSNIGLVTVMTDVPHIVSLSEQPWSVISSSGLKVSIITSRQTRCIFGNMFFFKQKNRQKYHWTWNWRKPFEPAMWICRGFCCTF